MSTYAMIEVLENTEEVSTVLIDNPNVLLIKAGVNEPKLYVIVRGDTEAHLEQICAYDLKIKQPVVTRTITYIGAGDDLFPLVLFE